MINCCELVQGLLQELGIYLLSFDRPGNAESDAHPARTEKSIALDIAELADNLQLGPKFHLIGFSMGGEIMWSCLKHIPHRWVLARTSPIQTSGLCSSGLPRTDHRAGVMKSIH